MSGVSRKKVIIIGSGISGATAYKTFIDSGMTSDDIIIVEKMDRVGGKLWTYRDESNPSLVTEYGAGVFTQNYGIIDILKKENIKSESLVNTKRSTIEFFDTLYHLSLFGKIKYAIAFLWQNVKFARLVWSYNRAHTNLQEKIPAGFDKPFATFATDKKISLVASFITFLGPSFGYGSFDDEKSYAYKMLAYMGYTTILGICGSSNGLVCLQGGYQQLVEKMLKKANVQTSAKIDNITRNEKEVTVSYTQHQQRFDVTADLLIIATSPADWSSLGMSLTAAEKECMDNCTYFRYPIAICKLKGMPPKHVFVRSATVKEGFGHAAFLFTRDNRPDPQDGRLFTIYINIARENKHYQLTPGNTDWMSLINDLMALGATDVNILKTTIWEDYNPTIPYSTGIRLQKEERLQRTLHLGGYMPGSFETVAGTEEYARKTIQRYLNQSISTFADIYRQFRRALIFYAMKHEKPYAGSNVVTGEQINQTAEQS